MFITTILFITNISKYLNFAIFSMVYFLFLQYCGAALDVNIVIQFSKILLHLQDKPFTFSSRSHVCIPSVPQTGHLFREENGTITKRLATKQNHSQ